MNVAQLEEITLPSQVIIVPRQCFALNKKLRKVTMEGKVRRLGIQAFAYCPELVDIVFKSSNPPSLTDNDWPFPEDEYFSYADGTARIHFSVPRGSVDAYLKAWKVQPEDKRFFKEI